MFKLNDLSTAITNAISNGGSTDTLSSGLAKALLGWLSSTGFSIMSGFLIFIVVLFVFYGGFLYFTAFGDENRATKAKKTLLYAFVGLLIALTAFASASYVQRVIINKAAEQELKIPTK